MGLIRSGLVLTIGSILFLTIFLGNIFLTLSWSLEFENIEDNMGEISIKAMDSIGIREVIEENYGVMTIYCDISGEDSFSYDSQEFSISIPCETIAQGPDAMIEYGAKQFVYDIYYKEYSCEFFTCLKETDGPYVLISEKAQQYWDSKFYLSLAASIILMFLLFLVIEKKHMALTVAGILTIISALPFRKLNWILTFLPGGELAEMALAFFTRSYNVFLIMIIVGISMLVIGIAFEFLGIGFSITKFIEKIFGKKEKKGEVPITPTDEEDEIFTKDEVKEIVKEEIAKSKRKDTIRKEVKKAFEE